MALMKESKQMLGLVSFCGYYLLTLTVIYLLQSIYQLRHLSESDFYGKFVSRMYDIEVFMYSKEIEKIKVVHAISLMCIGIYLVFFTRKFKVLNKSHYRQILTLTVVVTILYFLPII